MNSLIEALRARYREGRLVVFAGAGVSASGGLPAWRGLIQQILADARAGAASAADSDALAEADGALARGDLVGALGAAQTAMTSAAWGRVVSRALDDTGRPVPALARAIAGLAPALHAVVTTNLDRLLDRAFAGEWPSFTLPQLDLGQQRHYILQLHGTRTDRSSWVLGERDYEELLHGRPELQRFIEGLFRFHPLLFVGYGMRDPDFDRLCGQARVASRGQAPQHFALMPAGHVGAYERRRLAEAGIEVIPYDDPDGSNKALLHILGDLAASQAAVRTPDVPVVPVMPVMPVMPVSSGRTTTVLMISASPDTHVRLRVDQEFREIITRMRGTRHRDRFHFIQIQAMRFDDLRIALMEHQPHVLHISTHGEPDGALVLEGPSAGGRVVPTRNMLRLLESLRDNLRLVVLNACDSHLIARELPQAVGLAIGMSDKVKDTAAIEFAVAFYEGLGYGRSVESAFEVALAGLGELDDEIPRLFPSPADDPQRRRSQPLLPP